MSRAYGVAVHFPQDLQLPFRCADIEGRTQGAQVVALVDALQPKGLPIDQDGFFRIERQGADPEARLVFIDQPACCIEATDRRVKATKKPLPATFLSHFLNPR